MVPNGAIRRIGNDSGEKRWDKTRLHSWFVDVALGHHRTRPRVTGRLFGPGKTARAISGVPGAVWRLTRTRQRGHDCRRVSRPPLSVGNVMKKGLLTFGILTALAIFDAQAQSPQEIIRENWRCYGRLDFAEKTVLVKLTRMQKAGSDTGIGTVSVAGIAYLAQFRVAGFDRRWDFGEGDIFKYSFVIHPDGNGAYYVFFESKTGRIN